MATKTIDTPDAYKAYLMEIFSVLVYNQKRRLEDTKDPHDVAEKWGRNQNQAEGDIEKARNLLMAVRLFISKAVDDNLKELQISNF